MIRIAICDDEKESIDIIKKYIKEVTEEINIIVEVNSYVDWKNLEYDLSENEVYDVIFMDIEYGSINGINLVANIKEKYPTTNVIFVTGYYEYVFDVFEVQPFGFLRKPIIFEDFKRVLIKAINKSKKIEMFEYEYNRVIYKLPLSKIVWFNSNGRMIYIKTLNGERKFYGKLDEVEKKVNFVRNVFFRISQSYLVNSLCIVSVGHNEICVNVGENKEKLRITRGYKDYVMKKYMNDWDEM